MLHYVGVGVVPAKLVPLLRTSAPIMRTLPLHKHLDSQPVDIPLMNIVGCPLSPVLVQRLFQAGLSAVPLLLSAAARSSGYALRRTPLNIGGAQLLWRRQRRLPLILQHGI